MTLSLDSIRKNNFLIIGRAGMDLYPDPPGTRTEEASQFFACLGGSSANIGVAIVKCGGQASLLTSVSDDAVGRFCLNELDRYKVDRTFVKSVGGECRNSLAVVESRVEDHQSVIYRNNAADFQMTEADVQAPEYGSYGALITTGTVLAAEPSRSSCLSAFKRAKDSSIGIIFDIDYRPYSWASGQEAAETYSNAASFCDVVIGNDDEFDVMAGGSGLGLDFAKNLAKQGANIVIYKMGEKGSIAFTADGQEIATGIFKVEALKPTGAGDSFLAVLVSSLASNWSLKESIIRGSAAAALVVSRVGCAPAMPTTEEIDSFIKTHPGLSNAG